MTIGNGMAKVYLTQPSVTRNCWLMTESMKPGRQPAPHKIPRINLLRTMVLLAFT